MVVSADPFATDVGVQILKQGGNAIDAAVAVGFALAVTYPTAGNLGGGGYMVIHFADGRETALDYRETAPFSACENMYLDSTNRLMRKRIIEGESSAGVPGSVAGMLYALEKYGTMTRTQVIGPAIQLAANGFLLSSSTAASFKSNQKYFKNYPSSAKIFTRGGDSYSEGELFRQQDLANTLDLIKQFGRDGFYKGTTAELIVKQMAIGNAYLSLNDLDAYHCIEREALKGSYRGYDILSMPPSSSGGVALIELLNILENVNFTKAEWGSSRYYHYLIESMKLAYADRSEFLGDPAFYPVPIKQLTSKEYAKLLFAKISSPATRSSQIKADTVLVNEGMHTTHYSVIDRWGNAVSVTTTINSSYGSKVVVEGAGFLLNNEMDDFSAQPGVANQFGLTGGKANAIEPGKRMLSSMTPTIVLKNSKPFLILGSPGGSTIITTVLQVILNCAEYDMPLRKAVDAPRIHHQWLPDKIDYEPFALSEDVKNNLIARGHIFGAVERLGMIEAIMIDPAGSRYYGYSDSRGYGKAAGY